MVPMAVVCVVVYYGAYAECARVSESAYNYIIQKYKFSVTHFNLTLWVIIQML